MPTNEDKTRTEQEIGTEKSAFAKAAGLEKAMQERDLAQEPPYTPRMVLGIDNATAARANQQAEGKEEKTPDLTEAERKYVETFRDSPLRGGKANRDLMPTGAGQAVITDDGVAGTDDPLDASTGPIDKKYDEMIAMREEEMRRREYAKRKEEEKQKEAEKAAKERERARRRKEKGGDAR